MNAVTAQFITKADDTGINKVRKGLKDIGNDAATLNSNTKDMGAGIEKFLSKAERPASSLVFRNLAVQALGASGAFSKLGESGQIALTGIEILGRGAIGVTGTVGIAVVAITALVAIAQKLGDTTKEAAEKIKKQTLELAQSSATTREAQETLKKLVGLSPEVVAGLNSQSDAERKKALATIEGIKANADAEISAKNLLALNEKGVKLSFEQQWKLQVLINKIRDETGITDEASLAKIAYARSIGTADSSLKNLTSTSEAAKILLESSNKEQKNANALLEAQANAHAMIMERISASIVKSGDLSKAKELEKDAQLGLIRAQDDYIAAVQRGDLMAAESANKRVEAKQKELTFAQNTEKKMEELDKQRLASIQQYTKIASDFFKAENGKILVNTREVFAQEVKSFADMIAAEMEMKAAASFTNPALAAAFIAAAIAIRAAGSLASAAITAGGQTGGVAGGGGGGGTPGMLDANASPQNGANRQMNVNVYVQGHILGGDAALADNLSRILSERAVAGGMTLVATSVTSDRGTRPF